MLSRLERLLPIPTGAKMNRWRKMVIQRIKEGKKDEVKEETKMHKRHFRAACRQSE